LIHPTRKAGATKPDQNGGEDFQMGDTAMVEHQEGPLVVELQAFEDMKASLEQNHMGKFVVIKDGKLVGAWDTLDTAARTAVVRFGRGPYLIRQVGAPTMMLPASVMFRNLVPA
jgi:hypothetical protein